MMLLDTCALLWLMGDQTKLSADARRAIDDVSNSLVLSAISVLEVGRLAQTRRLHLPKPAETWFEEVRTRHQIRFIDITWSTALRSAELPPVHKDPADRIIVATAMEFQMPIITADADIAAYPGVTVIW